MSYSSRSLFCKEFSAAMGMTPDQVTLYWKGRVGLYGLLHAMGVGAGDEVIIPAFTCVVVPNAIIYLGAKPVYAEVDLRTFNVLPEAVEACWSEKTKVVIGQNTFGLSCDLEALLDLCDQKGGRLIEDCTHGFGGTYKGQPNGTIAEAAFFSSQWNKPFSTGFGGIVVCRDLALSKAMQDFSKNLLEPGRMRITSLRAQLFARQYLMHPRLYWSALKLYRMLSKSGIVSGSSAGEELEGVQMPEDYLMKMSELQATKGLQGLRDWEENFLHRKNIASIYEKCLSQLGHQPIFIPPYASHTFIRYPILVRDRKKFFALAEAARIPLGDWMLSPIHPIQTSYSNWNYAYGTNPVGEFLSRHVINLLTDQSISEKQAHKVCRFLNHHYLELMSWEDYQ